MAFQTINPASGELLQTFPVWQDSELEAALTEVDDARGPWQRRSLSERCAMLRSIAQALKQRREHLAALITLEMGKLHKEALSEVDKCASGCEFYADNAEAFLADEIIASDAGRSYVAHEALGAVLAIMPWNFPLWQVFRFAAPALVAGNTALLKHASNVPQCALAIEEVMRQAGVPPGVFRTLMIDTDKVGAVIGDRRVRAVTLTGSERAGRAVAALAGKHLKKAVLELGGSDAFIVLNDADLAFTVKQAVLSRYMNAGQSCIAAKRFVVESGIADAFVERFRAAVAALTPGDPLSDAATLAPMARGDLRDELHAQVQTSLVAGARLVTGGAPLDRPGFYYAASIIDGVKSGMPAFDEELFGPVASVVRVDNEDEAIAVANATRFGLGGSVWTKDHEKGERVANALQCGCAFVNGLVKSDPRLPFGGVKDSGYGRELSYHGMYEFLNIKTVWVR